MAARTRRQFLIGAAGVGAFTIVPRWVLGGSGYVAPSDRLTHAIIGTGGMGMGHVNFTLNDPQAKLVAVCDVDSGHLGRAVNQARGGNRGKGANPDCKGYSDFRDVLDRGDVDIVHIPTPPHWHALISIAAAEAGCDIWCEKPMTRTIAESQAVVDAVQRHGRMFRINTWFRLYDELYGMSVPTKPLKQLVSGGALGWPVTARLSHHTGFNWKLKWSGRTNLQPQGVPRGFDYDMWLGPAPVKPYNRHRTHMTFRGYWDYDSGGLGDMGQHYLDPTQYILGKDDTSPVEIVADGPWPQHPDAVGAWYTIEMKYADGCRIILESSASRKNMTAGQPYLEGPKGKIFPGLRTDPADLKDAIKTLPQPAPMITDFNESVRTRKPFGLNERNAHRSNLLVHLADIAFRMCRPLKFDPVTQRFIGNDAANRLIDQPMRAPWHL